MTALPGRHAAARRLALLVPIAAFALAAMAAPAPAEEAPSFQMPLECEIGVDCWVLRYFDHDPSAGTRDHECGFLTGDGHRGIDIRVRDYVAMRAGMVVVAAADGVVRATRDGVEDVAVQNNTDSREEVSRYGLGNTVILDHGGGWQSAYGHMMKGSVLVKEGDHVTAGQPLGMVGLSGLTSFPHVHFMVKYNDKAVDPFTGLKADPACGDTSATLWAPEALAELQYIRTAMLIAGFSDVVPNEEDASSGHYDQSMLRPDGEAIVFWYHLMGANKDDRETIRVIAPDGRTVVEREKTYQKNRVLVFDFIGDKNGGQRLAPGIYRAEYRLVRDVDGVEQTIIGRTFEINVP
jgi:hypothetical protein